MIIRCPFCTRSHSIAEITKEQIQSEADNPTGVLVSDFPNPSADEEVERLAVKMAADCYQRLAIYRPGILTEVQTTLKDFAALIRQQHNAEREELAYLKSVKAAWDDAWANHDGDVLKQTVAALKAELATAQAERFTPSKLNTKYLQQIESLKSQLQSAMEERDAAIRNRDEWQNAATEAKRAYESANSRLEEAHKDLGADYRKHLDAAMQLGETCSCTDINYLIDVLDAVLLSRLSTSRSTENKT